MRFSWSCARSAHLRLLLALLFCLLLAMLSFRLLLAMLFCLLLAVLFSSPLALLAVAPSLSSSATLW